MVDSALCVVLAGGLRKQGINAIVQQNQEFSIQNEDFPALPGFKGGRPYDLFYLLRFVECRCSLSISGVVLTIPQTVYMYLFVQRTSIEGGE